MPKTLRLAVGLITVLILLSSCAKRIDGPPPNVGYEALQETLDGRDVTPLHHRHILLDPGHGGFFQGVVGRDGLSEADANLGVALYLRGLLEAAGARVHMTRTTDRDFLSPADSTLAIDLNIRSAMVDSLRPDAFLSLHHNSNAALDRDLNETQTYYPAGRNGADLDLARAIHTHLVRNLGIQPAKILAGNFSVLRHAPQDVPSVLGEPSMLSNPLVEAKLVTAEKMELEAQAYFLGFLDFFSAGQPSFEDIQHFADGRTRLNFVRDVWSLPSAPGLDPTSISVSWSGRTLPYSLGADGTSILVQRPPEAGQLLVTADNLAGRQASSLTTHLQSPIPTSVVMLTWTAIQESDAASAPRSLVSWSTTGPWSLDDFPDASLWSGFGTGESAGTRLENVIDLPHDMQHSGGTESISSPPCIHSHAGRTLIISGRRTKLQTGYSWVRLVPDVPGAANWVNRLWSLDSPFTEANLPPPATMSFIPVHADHPLWLERPGYHPVVRQADGSLLDDITWRAILPALQGKTIVIDPAGGGPDHQGHAPMGTPGRELNLKLAKRLASLLQGAGAIPVLTRANADWVPKEHKVLLTNRVRGDLFLTIARNNSGNASRLTHHHGSTNGERWARLTAQALTESGTSTLPIGPSYAYLLRHTAPPALLCEMAMPTTSRAEDMARSPAAQQADAFALLRAIAAYFSEPPRSDLPAGWDPASFMARHRTAVPHPRDQDQVRIDGNWLWLPPVVGAPKAILPPISGTRTLEIRTDDQWWVMKADLEGNTLRPLLYGMGDRALSPEESAAPQHEVLHDQPSID